MKKRLVRFIPIISVLLIAVGVAVLHAEAQAPGFAEITRPLSGEAVVGVVTIEGSASHPAFLEYDLSFGLDPDPTETWFPILDAVRTPVSQGSLGIWDTSELTDGEYRLRLKVHLSNGSVLEALTTSLRVRNRSPIETQTPAPDRPPATPTTQPPTATPTEPPKMAAPQEGSNKVLQAFTLGGFVGLSTILLIAAFLLLRRRLRLRWSALQMRWVHHRERRQREAARRRRK